MKCPLDTSLDPRDIYFTFVPALESNMVETMRVRTTSLVSVDGHGVPFARFTVYPAAVTPDPSKSEDFRS